MPLTVKVLLQMSEFKKTHFEYVMFFLNYVHIPFKRYKLMFEFCRADRNGEGHFKLNSLDC